MRRLFWVAVGAAAGVYAVRKVQKTLHAYSPSGLAERAGGVGAACAPSPTRYGRGMAEREAELREALGMEPADHDAPLTPGRGRRPDRPPREPRLAPRTTTADRSRST